MFHYSLKISYNPPQLFLNLFWIHPSHNFCPFKILFNNSKWLKISNWGAQQQIEHLHHTLFFRLRDHCGRGSGKSARVRSQEDWGKMLSSGPNSPAALTNYSSYGCLHKISPVNIHHGVGRASWVPIPNWGDMEFFPLSLWVLEI